MDGDKAGFRLVDALQLDGAKGLKGSSKGFRGKPKPSTKGPDSSNSSCTEFDILTKGNVTRRGLKNVPLRKIVHEKDPLPAGFMQSRRAGYDTAAATQSKLEVKVVEEVKAPYSKFETTVKRPLAKCPLCGCKIGNTDEAYQTCGLCGADEYSFCTRCFIPWTCEIASLAAATRDTYFKAYVNASHICCECIAAMPRMTARDALGTEKPRMTRMTHQEWDHINVVFKYVDEHGFPPIEIVACSVLEVKLPAADHGHASSKASTLPRENSWTLASTLSTEDSWTLIDE